MLGFFNKKKTDIPKTEAPKIKNKMKSNNGMESVLQESVAATVESELLENEAFIRHVNNKELYVGLLLDVDDIGGLDAKTKKDEDKGSLINALNSGLIKSVITDELMQDNKLIFIPDANTLNAMLDYGILDVSPVTHEPIKYLLVSVVINGDKITYEPLEPETKLTYEEISDLIINDEGIIDDLFVDNEPESNDLFDKSDSDTSNDSDEDDEDIKDIDAESDDSEDLDDDDIEDMSDIEDIEPKARTVKSDSNADADINNTDSDESNLVSNGPSDDNPYLFEDENNESEEEVPSAWVDDIIVRKFYSDDLGLEITTEPFDAQFLQNNPPALFDEKRPSGWLNDQLNEMSRLANQELKKLHQNQLFKLRERYFNLLSKSCDRIQQDLDINNPDTQYGQIYAKLRENRDDELAGIQSRVGRKVEDLQSAWKRKLQEVGQDAARAAQQAYRSRYSEQHEKDIYNIEQDVRSMIDGEYNDAYYEMNERRRLEASKLLDLSISETLNETSDMYTGILEEENARYQELEENMKAFIEENRSNDIARTKVLEEQLNQSQKADKVLAEQTEILNNYRAEWNKKRDDLNAEIDKMRKDNAARIKDLQEEADKRVAKLQEQTDALTKRIAELNQEKADLRSVIEKELEQRIAVKDNEAQVLRDRLDDTHYMQHRTNVTTVYLVLAATLAALSIGFVGGSYINLNRKYDSQAEELINEYKNNHVLDESESATEPAPETESSEAESYVNTNETQSDSITEETTEASVSIESAE